MTILSDHDLVEQRIRECRGNLAAVARMYGVARQTVWAYVQSRPLLVEAVQDCRETMLDDAENSLHQAVLRGEPWAVCFYLKCQGKGRGYVERTEYRNMSDEQLNAEILRELERLDSQRPRGLPAPAEG